MMKKKWRTVFWIVAACGAALVLAFVLRQDAPKLPRNEPRRAVAVPSAERAVPAKRLLGVYAHRPAVLLEPEPEAERDLLDVIRIAYPDAGWSPVNETYSEYCDRAPNSDHIVYGEGKHMRIAVLKRSPDAYAFASCAGIEILHIEEDAPERYTIVSEEPIDIYSDNGGAHKRVPLLIVEADGEHLGEVIEEAKNWLETLQMARASSFKHPALRDMGDAYFSQILNERNWTHIRLSPGVWRKIFQEQQSLTAMPTED